MKIALAGLVVASLTLAAGAHAQDLTGTYHARSQSSDIPVTLQILQNHLGEITGTLSAQSVTFAVQGRIAEGRVFGTMKADSVVKFFEAVLHQSVLSTTLYEVGPTGSPDYLSGDNIQFRRQETPVAMQGSPTEGLARDQALRMAFATPRELVGRAYLSRRILMEALFQATALSERAASAGIVSSGTLIVQGTDIGYDVEPADRFVVDLDGRAHEFTVEEIQGNFLAASATEWLVSTHALRYRYRRAEQSELSVVLSYDQVLFSMDISGWHVDSGTRFDTDLVASGQASGTLGENGHQLWASFSTTGSLRGGGLEITVRQEHRGNLGVSSGVLHPDASRAVASGRSRVNLNNNVRMGEEVYGFNKVEMATEVHLTAGAAEVELISLTGSLFRGGDLFGSLVLLDGQPVVQVGPNRISLAGTPDSSP